MNSKDYQNYFNDVIEEGEREKKEKIVPDLIKIKERFNDVKYQKKKDSSLPRQSEKDLRKFKPNKIISQKSKENLTEAQVQYIKKKGQTKERHNLNGYLRRKKNECYKKLKNLHLDKQLAKAIVLRESQIEGAERRAENINLYEELMLKKKRKKERREEREKEKAAKNEKKRQKLGKETTVKKKTSKTSFDPKIK